MFKFLIKSIYLQSRKVLFRYSDSLISENLNWIDKDPS